MKKYCLIPLSKYFVFVLTISTPVGPLQILDLKINPGGLFLNETDPLSNAL